MTPSDVCRHCDGVGRLINRYRSGLSAIVTCPVCEGIGWDPEAVSKELQERKQALENLKL